MEIKQINLLRSSVSQSFQPIELLKQLEQMHRTKMANQRLASHCHGIDMTVVDDKRFFRLVRLVFLFQLESIIMSQQGAALQNYNNELVKCMLLFFSY